MTTMTSWTARATCTPPVPKRLPDSVVHFFSEHYQGINIARLRHLDSLGLELEGKHVLDLGAGIGDHSLFYRMKGCDVTALEGRGDLVEFIRYRLGIHAETCDMETDLDLLAATTGFDIVHCYGLLYHLANPARFLAVAAGCGTTMLLETVVAPDDTGEANPADEDRLNATQALSGHGCRPNRKWLYAEMKKHFPNVYVPFHQPRHPQFPRDWATKNATHSRIVYIGSHQPLRSPALSAEFLAVYRP